MNAAEEAYELLLSLARQDEDVLELLRAFVHTAADPGELLDRFREEHEFNAVGRIEGRVHEISPGVWEADPLGLGTAGPQRFSSEHAARQWIRLGGAYAPAVNLRGSVTELRLLPKNTETGTDIGDAWLVESVARVIRWDGYRWEWVPPSPLTP